MPPPPPSSALPLPNGKLIREIELDQRNGESILGERVSRNIHVVRILRRGASAVQSVAGAAARFIPVARPGKPERNVTPCEKLFCAFTTNELYLALLLSVEQLD